MRVAPILTILISMCLLALLQILNMINYSKVPAQNIESFLLISPTVASIISVILCILSMIFAGYRIFYVVKKRRARKSTK